MSIGVALAGAAANFGGTTACGAAGLNKLPQALNPRQSKATGRNEKDRNCISLWFIGLATFEGKVNSCGCLYGLSFGCTD
jgi:hypothetical protein